MPPYINYSQHRLHSKYKHTVSSTISRAFLANTSQQDKSSKHPHFKTYQPTILNICSRFSTRFIRSFSITFTSNSRHLRVIKDKNRREGEEGICQNDGLVNKIATPIIFLKDECNKTHYSSSIHLSNIKDNYSIFSSIFPRRA